MIARELLVKLGFDIDESKFNRFTQNVEAAKAKLSNFKNHSGLNANLTNLNDVKEQMLQAKKEITKHLHPKGGYEEFTQYKENLKTYDRGEREKFIAMDKIENAANKDRILNERANLENLKAVHCKLLETKKSFKATAQAAKAATMTFSRYFARFAMIGAGSFMLSMRNTLKDAEAFKAGGAKTNNNFSSKQISDVNRFNVSVKQLKKTLGELRNKFIIDLLPTFKENLDLLNEWFLKNKVLINSKVEKFIQTLGSAFRTLASASKVIFNVLNPLVSLIGGWGVIAGGIIGAGILSWLVRLGIFLSSGATAIKVFAVALKVLTMALITNPICLTIGAIAAVIALLADEFIVTAKGGDSLINRFGGLNKMGDSFVETLKEIWQWLVKVKDNMFDFTIGGMDKVKDFFKGTTGQKPMQKPHEMLQDSIAPNIKEYGGLKVTHAVDHFKLNTPPSNYHNSRAENNEVKTVNSNNKNTFNFSINVPKGTGEEQSRVIAREVQKQVQAELNFHNEKTLNAIGAI